MIDSLRTVRDHAVALERQLDSMGAVGSGLGEKARSLELPTAVQEDLRQVVHLRNMVMHDGVDLAPADLRRFEEAADRAMAALSGRSGHTATTASGQPAGCGATLMAMAVIVGLAWFLSSVIHHQLIDTLIWVVASVLLWGAFANLSRR